MSDRFQPDDRMDGLNDEFSNIGSVNLFGQNIPVAKEDGNYYILHQNTGQIVCSATEISDFIHKNRVIWAKTRKDTEHEMMMNKNGEHLIDIRTAKSIKCEYPSEIENNTFKTNQSKIIWNEFDFEKTQHQNKTEKSTEEDQKDQKEEIEDFLENIDLKFGKPPDRIDDVESPESLVRLFDNLGQGDMDEGNFIPPTQDEYANYGYVILKNKASNNSEMFTEEYREDWKGRLRRAWTSFVRDSHFATKMSQQKDEFDEVDHGLERDLSGADSLIIEDETEYHINLFVDSEKSKDYLEQKKNYRQDNDVMMPEKATEGPIDVLVPLQIKDNGANDVIESNNGRDIYLYSDEHIQAVKNLVKENKKVVKDNQGNILCQVRS